MHRQRALVLINEDQATPQDIVALAHQVRQRGRGENLPCGWSQRCGFIGGAGRARRRRGDFMKDHSVPLKLVALLA